MEEYFLIFRLINEVYAFRIEYIYKVIPVIHFKKIPESPDFLVGLIQFEGNAVPVINIYEKFGLRKPELDLSQKIVIVKNGNNTYGILIDEILAINKFKDEDIVSSRELMKGLENFFSVLVYYEDSPVLVFEIEKFLKGNEILLLNEVN